MFKTVMCSSLLAGLIAFGGVHATTLAVMPVAQAVSVGDSVTVNLQISGLGTGLALGVFDIDFGFDPALLSLSKVQFGNGLDVLGLGSFQAATPGIGSINLFEVSFDTAADLNALQPDSFDLATLVFNALTSGTSAFTLSVNALGDADGIAFPIAVLDGSATIGASVPEPGTYALCIIGFSALGIALRRKKQRIGVA